MTKKELRKRQSKQFSILMVCAITLSGISLFLLIFRSYVGFTLTVVGFICLIVAIILGIEAIVHPGNPGGYRN